MNIAPERLQNNGYYLYARYDFEELLDVISRELRRRTPHMIAYWLLLGVFGLGALIGSFAAAGSGLWIPFVGVLVGAVGMIAVIPIHEALHALAFLIRGARSIRFGARLQYLMFYAIARNFVASYREMLFILYLPAAAISTALVAAAIVLGAGPAGVIAGSGAGTLLALTVSAVSWLALIHWSACAGDAALASYMWRHKHLEIVTGDDGEQLVTSFYVRTPVGTARTMLR